MGSKLDDIKQALADYEAAKIAYEAAAKHVAAQGRASREDRIAEDTYDGERASMGRNAPDYLRALLTVVDTAAEIREPTVVTDGQTKMECACCGNRIRASIRENQHEEDCPWWVLQKALKAFE